MKPVPLVCPPIVPPERLNSSSFSGVWIQHGNDAHVYNRGFVLGTDKPAKWCDVQVAQDKWDWNATDQSWATAASAGYYIETAFSVYVDAPAWLYDHVQKVRVKGKKGNAFTAPYFLDPAYRPIFLNAVKTFAAHIAGLPHFIRKRIVVTQAMFGSEGDDTPWHGTPVDRKYVISNVMWKNFTMGLAPQCCEIFRNHGIHILWNTDYDKEVELLKLCPGSYIKAGIETHGYQSTNEADDYKTRGIICHTEGHHCRGESWPFMTQGYVHEAPLWATYTHLMWQLKMGVDMPDLSEPGLLNDSYVSLYELFNRYAGSIRPPSDEWFGGIIALRDGLDSSDTSRLPESQFGEAKLQNQDRLTAIAKAFATWGAAEEDPASAAKNPFASRNRHLMNDVGWNIYTGNYGNGLIEMLKPSETSIGRWRVGPRDQQYGQFARSFQSKSGRTEMSFVLDKRLWGGLPFKATHPPVVDLEVVYFDADGGSFEVMIHSGSGCRKTNSVKLGHSKRWKILNVTVSDGRFGQGCMSKGVHADIVLRSTAEEDPIIHGLQIYKLPVSIRPLGNVSSLPYYV